MTWQRTVLLIEWAMRLSGFTAHRLPLKSTDTFTSFASEKKSRMTYNSNSCKCGMNSKTEISVITIDSGQTLHQGLGQRACDQTVLCGSPLGMVFPYCEYVYSVGMKGQVWANKQRSSSSSGATNKQIKQTNQTNKSNKNTNKQLLPSLPLPILYSYSWSCWYCYVCCYFSFVY